MQSATVFHDTPMKCLSVSNGRIWQCPFLESMHVCLLFHFTAVFAAFVPESKFALQVVQALLPLIT